MAPKKNFIYLLEDQTLNIDMLLKNVKKFQVHEINKGRKDFGEYHHLFPILKTYPDRFLQYLHMPVDCFDYILSKIEKRCTKNWNNFHQVPIDIEERLVVTIRYLSNGISYRAMSFSFRMGVSTISNIIRETVSDIWYELHSIYMPVPTEESFFNVATKFFDKWQFPHCIGAIDSKHIKIKRPPHSGALYFNYKKYYSIVLQAVVDADYKFLIIDVGGYGKQHDSATFYASSVYKAIQLNELEIPKEDDLPNSQLTLPYFFVGDGAYPLTNYLMKPYPGQNLPKNQETYNYRLSRARMVVECAFGQLSKRWNVFYTTMEQKPETICEIVKCACLLHNLIIQKRNNIDTLSDNSIKIHSSDYNTVNTNCEVLGLSREIRFDLTEYFSL